MALQDISLPIDIPWRLIATSRDMLADRTDRFPHATWKPSLAIFAYDPDLSDLPEEFPDRELTFLKVVCSLTSYTPPCYQPTPFRTPPTPPDPNDFGESFQAYEEALRAYEEALQEYQNKLVERYKVLDVIKGLTEKSYPCSGAFIQVAIYPREGNTNKDDVSQLAFFTAFQPQKRELIEVVSESGEALTQSKSTLNVRKGVTSTDSTEDLDVFMGVNANVGAGGAQVGVGVSGQWGTVKKSGSESVNVTNTDSSREIREGASHTTSLSQLYHLLNSYHLGTNRAIFFLQPRPHTVQQKDRFTFIDGPQEIEGVQEFFLVVNRPKGKQIATNYCVDALLYTAHLDSDAAYNAITDSKTAESPWYELWAATPWHAPDNTNKSLFDILLVGLFTGLYDFPPAAAGWAMKSQFDEQNRPLPPPVDTAKLAELFHVSPSDVLPDAPKILSRTFSLDPNKPSALDKATINMLGPGWRIDRTRGMGGYDLWEDPFNRTASPSGVVHTDDKDLSKDTPVKPQAFIDILPIGDPEDLQNPYRPDGSLTVEVMLWPPQDRDKIAMYHGRIKIYFIRDELPPTTGRTVTMFVLPRGASTCGDSPCANYSPDQAVEVSPDGDILDEYGIRPLNIAPWTVPPPPAPSVNVPASSSDGNAQGAPTPQPTNSARPSGLDAAAIGSARAKMANAMIPMVREKLVASVRSFECGGDVCPRIHRFIETDFFFERVATELLRSEMEELATNHAQDTRLATYIAHHPALLAVRASARSMQTLTTYAAQPKVMVHTTANPRFPVLTLASPALNMQERSQLYRAGVFSGLDLLGMPASDLAARLNIEVGQARKLRLRVLGLG